MSKTIKVSNGDWSVDSRGRFSYVGDEDPNSDGREKVAQDLANVLSQEIYADRSWGSGLGTVEQNTILDTVNAHQGIISQLVHDAVLRLIAKQEAQTGLPDTERIRDYTVTVDRMPQKALSYFFYVQLRTVAGEKVPLNNPYVIELEQMADPALLNKES